MTHEQVITVLADAVVTLHRRLEDRVQSSLVTWQLRELDGQAWVLSMTIGGLTYDVARVQAVDRDAAAKAVATQVELLLHQAQ
jgi:hypothetical protein